MTAPNVALGSLLTDIRPGFASGDDLAEGIFQIRMNNLSQSGELLLDKRRRVSPDAKQIPRTLLEPGDVLFNATNSPELVGKTAFFFGCDEPAVFSNHFIRLRTHEDWLDSRYLTRWLQREFQRGYFRAKAKQWVNQATFSQDRLVQMQIPLPPIEEQRRIAAVLDAADALRAKRRQALAKLDSLTQAIFIEMFGDPVRNPKRLDKTQLGDLIKLKSGQNLPAKDMQPGPHLVYGGNGVSGTHDQYMFDERQIVIGRVGVYCGCVHISEPQSWITDNALYVRWMSSRLRPRFLVGALELANLNQYASQAAQPLISGSRVYPVEILVPDMTDQIAFEERVRAEEALRELLDRDSMSLDALFASLQQRAFRGEL